MIARLPSLLAGATWQLEVTRHEAILRDAKAQGNFVAMADALKKALEFRTLVVDFAAKALASANRTQRSRRGYAIRTRLIARQEYQAMMCR